MSHKNFPRSHLLKKKTRQRSKQDDLLFLLEPVNLLRFIPCTVIKISDAHEELTFWLLLKLGNKWGILWFLGNLPNSAENRDWPSYDQNIPYQNLHIQKCLLQERMKSNDFILVYFQNPNTYHSVFNLFFNYTLHI